VLFGDATKTDLVGDFYTAETDFDIEDGDKTTVYYHHGLDATLGKRKLGRGYLKIDEVGVWADAQLKLRDEYEKHIWKMIQEGKMGWSSGVPAHLVEREPVGDAMHFTLWPLGKDASLTPIPAEPRTQAVALKAYVAELTNAEATPEDEPMVGPSADAVVGQSEAATDSGTDIGETDMSEQKEKVTEEVKAAVSAPDITSLIDYAKLGAAVVDSIKNVPVVKGDTLVVEKPPAPEPTKDQLNEAEMKAFQGYLLTGRATAGSQVVYGDQEGMKVTLQADSDIGGGFLVTPQMFVDQLIQDVDDMVFVRRYATKFTLTTADSMGAPSLETDMGDPTWTTELGTGSLDTSLEFGNRQLQPKPLARRIKVSRTLLRKAPRVESIVRERLAKKFAYVEENAFLNGTGANEPLGIFTVSDDSKGLDTSIDVTTAKATSFEADDFIKMKYEFKQQYWGKLRWCIHRDTVEEIAKLKDGEGRYIWDNGINTTDGIPRIVGSPVDMSEYAPHTMTAGLYVAALCYWPAYWIADALSMEVQVLAELYAETNQIGYIGRLECDGMPVHKEAFRRLKMAAS